MSDSVIPTIGSSGYFELKAPLTNLMVANEQYTCQAIRKINDYVANNENVLQVAYLDNGLTEQDYNEGVELKAYIVSLQSEKGHWLYIPNNYISKYPLTNGVAYRSVSLVIALPALEVSRNFSGITSDIQNLIMDNIGVSCEIKTVQTSRITLVAQDKHDAIQVSRNTLAQNRTTDRARYLKLLQEHQVALNKISQLENYIKTNA